MKNNKWSIIVGIILLVVLCLWNADRSSGTPPEVVLDGLSVTVGKTTESELHKQGFTVDYRGAFLITMEGQTWTSSIWLEKEDLIYASVAIANTSRQEKRVGECTVEELHFYTLDQEKKGALKVSINGVEPIGMTTEELKEAYPDLKLGEETQGLQYARLNDGDYSVSFKYEDGVMTTIDVTHSFGKSYSQK